MVKRPFRRHKAQPKLIDCEFARLPLVEFIANSRV